MEEALKKYQDVLLVFCAIILLVLIVLFYSWGVGVLVVNIEKALRPEGSAPAAGDLDIDSVKKFLQERGLIE